MESAPPANTGLRQVPGAFTSGYILPRVPAMHQMSLLGTKRTSRDVRSLVAIGGKADMTVASADFRV